jgi:hypothetical protein
MVHGLGSGQGWSWNGSMELPTFLPSILVNGHPGTRENGLEVFKDQPTCHSFVTAGQIQFLLDSSHSLAGKTVDLPDWDSE